MAEVVSNSEYDLDSISDGVNYLKDGYIEYAHEIITERALPDLRDGLKPVNRRAMVTIKNAKLKSHTKSATLAGNTMGLHPHADSSIYQAMVLMTQRNGSLAFPLLDGTGNFGGVYKTDPPAASRYTELMLHPNAKEYFGEMNGVKMQPNYDSTLSEPEVLPVSFPSVLVNSTSGIAVGFRSNIPSFNFNDICNLVIEYIEDGECSTVISPDFVTGGYYVQNNKELQKLMRTGTGRIKLRARSITDGKDINVTEVPFGKTLQGLIKQINDRNLNTVRNAYDTDDFEHGAGLTIICTAKNRIDETLYTLLKDTDLQYSYNADITVVDNGIPRRLGVWQVIEKWVEWRREVLLTEYNTRAEACKASMKSCSAFMGLMSDTEKKAEFVRIVSSQGKAAGVTYITNNYTREQIPTELIDWVAGRRLPDYHSGGKYASEFASATAELKQLEGNIANIDGVIVRDMKRLIVEYGSKMPRRTEITQTDYTFIESEDSKESIKDNSACVYSFKDGFLKKTRYGSATKANAFEFNGFASDTLIAFDNRGRILRVYCEDLPLHGAADLGVYLPRHFGFNESDDYKITWIGRLDGKELMLLFKDGNVGFVDTSEWTENTRSVKVLEKGINVSVADKLGAVLTEIPDVMMFLDTDGRIAYVDTATIKHKNRTAKTRVLNCVKGAEISSYIPCSYLDATLKLSNLDYYNSKLVFLKDSGDFSGTQDDVIKFNL